MAQDQDVYASLAMQAGEIALAAVAAASGAGTPAAAAYFSYMGAKQSYMGSLEGGAIGAATGALSGAGNAALMTNRIPGVNFGVTYNNQTGFGGNVGFGVGNGNWNTGGFVQFQESEGITGFGMNAGYGWGGTQTDPTSTVGLAFNYDRYGNFLGGQGTYGENLSDNWDMNFGLNFDADGNYSGTSIGGGYRRGIAGNGENSPLSEGHYRSGLGITFHQEGGYDLTLSGRLRNYNRYGSRFNGFDMSSSTTVGYNTRGGNESINQNVNVGFNFQTEAMAMEAISLYEDALNEKLKNGNLTPEEIADTKGDLAALGVAKARIDPTSKIKEYEGGDLMAAINISGHPDSEADAERIKQLHKEGKILSNQERHELAMKHDAITNDNTRDTWGERLLGPITDAWNWFSGDYSSVAGYINENGEWEQATCFVRGTRLLVLDDRGVVRLADITQLNYSFRAWACNEETNNQCGFYPIVNLFERESNGYYEVIYDGGLKIGVTGDHPMNMATGALPDWKLVEDLKPGMFQHTTASLLDEQRLRQDSVRNVVYRNIPMQAQHPLLSKSGPPVRIQSIRYIPGKIKVFNLEVAGAHTYFVGNERLAVHVHNAKYIGDFNGEAVYLADDGSVFSRDSGELGSPAYDGVDAIFDVITFGGWSAAKATFKSATYFMGMAAAKGIRGVFQGATRQATVRGMVRAVVDVNPAKIHFMQDSVKGTFKDKTTIKALKEALESGKIDPKTVEPIRVWERDGKIFTLDHRRLVAFQEAGIPIPVVQATQEEVIEEAWKMTTRTGGRTIRVRSE